MNPERALEILTALRDGTDPVQGTPLPADAPSQQPDVLRALFAACDALAPASHSGGRPPNAGKRWTEEDDTRLTQGHEAQEPISDLAGVLGRSRASVKLRLVHLGRLDADDAGVSPRYAAAATD